MVRFPSFQISQVPTLGGSLAQDRNSLGIMRLAMALAVLVSHCFFLSTGQMTAEPLIAWTGYTLGQHGVQVFFIMSGVLVMQSLMQSGSVRDYAIARALRIVPALLVCILLTALVLGPLVTTLSASQYLKDPATPRYIVKTALLLTGMAPLPGVFAGNAAADLVNSSLWTLKYEVICYVLLAGIGAVAIATQRYKEVFLAALAILLPLIFYKRPELAKANTLLDNIRYFALFFGTGVVAYVARHRLALTWLALPPLFAAFVLARGTYFAELTMALFLGYGALWLATFRFGPLRSFTNHQDYSYGVYIYGVPVTQALLYLHPKIDVLSLILVTAALVLPLAHASWELIERPALGLRRAMRKQGIATPRRAASRTPSVMSVRSMLDARWASAAKAYATSPAVVAQAPPKPAAAVPVARIAQAARGQPIAVANTLGRPGTVPRPIAPPADDDMATMDDVVTIDDITTMNTVVVPLRPRMRLSRPISVPS